MDFSNVDLVNFNYFRYPPAPIYYIPSKNIWVRPLPQPENRLVRTFKRARAVYQYLKYVLTGDPLANRRMNFFFDQNRAERDSLGYQQHFGVQGERLIEWLGSGNNTSELKFYGFHFDRFKK